MIETLSRRGAQNPAYDVAVYFIDNTMKRIRTYLLIAVAAGSLTVACSGEGSLVEVPATLMRYQHHPTEARLLALAKSYAEAINRNLEQQTPCPGQYADYGVALARLGRNTEANIMFNNEKMLFPNSSQYVDFLKQTLTPNQAADNRTDTTRIDVEALDSIPITYTPEEEALRRQQAEDPEYKRLMKQKAQEQRKKEAEAKREARKAQRLAEQEAQRAERARQDSISRAQKQVSKPE